MRYGLFIALFGLTALNARAEIYKSVDEYGHVTYSNIPTKGAKRLNIEPLTTLPKTGPEFRVDSRTQKMRDAKRYRILKEELDSEKGRLEQSRQAMIRAGGDEEKTRKSQEDVSLHEKNIEALEREISNLK